MRRHPRKHPVRALRRHAASGFRLPGPQYRPEVREATDQIPSGVLDGGEGAMAGFSVPQLLRKLGMLVQGGHFGHMNDVAADLKRGPVTVRGWGSGGGGGPPDSVPHSVLPQLVDLFTRALPDLPADEVRRLLSSPAEDLQSALGAATIPSLRDLIAHEADRYAGHTLSKG